MKCRACGGEAAVRLEYANLQLCREDFLRFFERRVARTIKRYRMLPRGAKVVVALSGGKDSSALLHVLWRLRSALGVEVEALTVDLGIGGYSELYVGAARALCARLGVPLRVVSLESEYGFTVDDVARRVRRAVCSACGTIKRYVLNREARRAGGYALATGHNLDDTLAAVLQAYVRGDVGALSKLGPALPPGGGFVARVKPLIETPEGDVRLYAEYAGIEYVRVKCPYSRGATSYTYKAALDLLEREHPGIKFQMLRSFLDRLQPALAGARPSAEQLDKCTVCGEPSRSPVCQFCRIRRQIGVRLREHG